LDFARQVEMPTQHAIFEQIVRKMPPWAKKHMQEHPTKYPSVPQLWVALKEEEAICMTRQPMGTIPVVQSIPHDRDTRTSILTMAFLPEVFVPGTSRPVQNHFVPSWYKEKWKKWKGENSGVTRFVKSPVHSEFIRLLFLQAHRKTDRFLQLQEFNFRNQIVYSVTTVPRFFLLCSNLDYLGLEIFSPRLQFYVLRLI